MKRIYLDANGFAFACAASPTHAKVCLAIIKRSKRLECQLLVSPFTVSEVLVKPVQMSQVQGCFQSPLSSLEQRQPCAVCGICNLYLVQLRAFQRVKPLDALHLACAAYAGADLFLTNDAALQRVVVPGIGRIAPLDFPF